MHTRTHEQLHTHTLSNRHAHTYTHTYTQTHKKKTPRNHAYVHKHKHRQAHTRSRARTHTHTHMRMDVQWAPLLYAHWSPLRAHHHSPLLTDNPMTRCGALGLRGERAKPIRQGVWCLLPVELKAVPIHTQCSDQYLRDEASLLSNQLQ